MKTVPILAYDSARPLLIPANAQVVAGYCDGEYAWRPEDWGRFPDAVKIIITVFGDPRANVADIENFAMTPTRALDWLNDRQHDGHHGNALYFSRGSWPAVHNVFRGRQYYTWQADWTGQPHTVPGAAMVQWQNKPDQAYDLSTVYDQEFLEVLDATNRPWPL